MFFGTHIPLVLVLVIVAAALGAAFALGVRFSNGRWRTKILDDPTKVIEEVKNWHQKETAENLHQAEKKLHEAQETINRSQGSSARGE
jgi:uncharacterized protein HemX